MEVKQAVNTTGNTSICYANVTSHGLTFIGPSLQLHGAPGAIPTDESQAVNTTGNTAGDTSTSFANVTSNRLTFKWPSLGLNGAPGAKPDGSVNTAGNTSIPSTNANYWAVARICCALCRLCGLC